MKKILHASVFLLFAHPADAQTYDAQNISLLSNWFDSTVQAEPFYGIKYQSVWGYAANGKEYAIIGSTAGTYIIEVTDPANPAVRDYVAGRRNQCIWREYKTYNNYLYMVSDDDPPNSLQIADLSYLPDSVHVVFDSDSLFARSHTIFIDGHYLYGGLVRDGLVGFTGLAVFDLTNPAKPNLVRTIEQDYPGLFGYAHDMYVRNDTVFASCAYDGLFILKFPGDTFTLLGSLISYPGQGYNHSSALTPDGKTLVFADEVPANLPVKICDVSDLNNIQVLDTFRSNYGATPHNPFFRGDNVIISYYQDGVQIFNCSNPSSPVRTGFFDTYWQNDTAGGYTQPPYAGCWGAYVDLPSGIVLGSDMQNGLFVLDASAILTDKKPAQPAAAYNNFRVFPNPFSDKINVLIADGKTKTSEIILNDITGKTILKKTADVIKNKIHIESPPDLPAGIYFLKIMCSGFAANYKLIKIQ